MMDSRDSPNTVSLNLKWKGHQGRGLGGKEKPAGCPLQRSGFPVGPRLGDQGPVPVTACSPPQCGTVDQGLYVNLTERNLQDAQKFILMHEVVQPVSAVPAFMEDDSRFSHVAVDVVQGRDALVHTIYLATGRGPPLSRGLYYRLLSSCFKF